MYTNAKILIVEDERIPAEFLKEILEKNGFNVVGICDKGSSAIESATKLQPDVIFMDIILKDNISGSEAALKISSLIQTKIIFLTAHSDNEMIDYALDVGAVNYLIKPYKKKQILAALQLALKTKNGTLIKDKKTYINLDKGYSYNFTDKRLYFENSKVDLGVKSMKLIQCLCEHINNVVSNEELSLYVYSEKKETSSIRALISRLNKALNYNIIVNSNGVGYKIISS
jgi:DNA-binding response OmpR family regulator